MQLYHRTPERLWRALTEALKHAPDDAQPRQILQQLPRTMDADLRLAMQTCLEAKPAEITWQALGYSLLLVGDAIASEARKHRSELLWTGPDVPELPSLRRIDQALYDGIARARERILLVTFAAVRIEHLNEQLEEAIERNVPLRLLLESAEASQGQLSFDAARAFSSTIKDHADIYCWAADQRLRNQRGHPAKLHAKFAVIDDQAYVSSANLTGDALERNIELGVAMFDKKRADELWELVEVLIGRGVFRPIKRS